MGRSAYGGRPPAMRHCGARRGSYQSLTVPGKRGLGGKLMARVQAERKRVDDVLDTDEARGLIESGRESGSLTTEEIALAFDELDLETGQLDDFYQALEEQQIEVVAPEADEETVAPGRVLEASTDALQLF